MKIREAIQIVACAARHWAHDTEPEETTQIVDACRIVEALPNEPANKPEMTVQLFASLNASERTATLARISSLMHPGPTSQEQTH